jgi:hypothetical protein
MLDGVEGKENVIDFTIEHDTPRIVWVKLSRVAICDSIRRGSYQQLLNIHFGDPSKAVEIGT